MKTQKIMIDAGFTCPNRDGRVGRGGCTFCRTESFCPAYCHGSITEQLQAGKRFFAGKYPAMRYLAYFQPHSNTYAPVALLRERYEEALADPDVVGLVIATRPDCLSPEVVRCLQDFAQRTQLTVEIGIESLYDRTLRRINRGHDAATTRDAIARCHEAGLTLCAHIIIGMPGETADDILREAEMLSALPIDKLKLHQLQILDGTPMADDWRQHPADFLSLTAGQYARLVADFVRRLSPTIHVERYASSAPSALLLHPRWGLKPAEIQRMVDAAIITLMQRKEVKEE